MKKEKIKYEWYEIGNSLMWLINTITEAGGVDREVEWREAEELMQNIFPNDSYGDRITHTGECVVLKDGKILCCLTIATWSGTFASHDNIRVSWYEGVPKT